MVGRGRGQGVEGMPEKKYAAPLMGLTPGAARLRLSIKREMISGHWPWTDCSRSAFMPTRSPTRRCGLRRTNQAQHSAPSNMPPSVPPSPIAHLSAVCALCALRSALRCMLRKGCVNACCRVRFSRQIEVLTKIDGPALGIICARLCAHVRICVSMYAHVRACVQLRRLHGAEGITRHPRHFSSYGLRRLHG